MKNTASLDFKIIIVMMVSAFLANNLAQLKVSGILRQKVYNETFS